MSERKRTGHAQREEAQAAARRFIFRYRKIIKSLRHIEFLFRDHIRHDPAARAHRAHLLLLVDGDAADEQIALPHAAADHHAGDALGCHDGGDHAVGARLDIARRGGLIDRGLFDLLFDLDIGMTADDIDAQPAQLLHLQEHVAAHLSRVDPLAQRACLDAALSQQRFHLRCADVLLTRHVDRPDELRKKHQQRRAQDSARRQSRARAVARREERKAALAQHPRSHRRTARQRPDAAVILGGHTALQALRRGVCVPDQHAALRREIEQPLGRAADHAKAHRALCKPDRS